MWMTTILEASPEGKAALLVGATFIYVSWRMIRRHLETKKPFGDQLPMPPGSHFILGHMGTRQFGADFRDSLKGMFVDYADEYGVCSFWMASMRGVSVNSWQDARALLQASTERKRLKLLAKHMNNFLGPRNIGVLRGKEWKYHRAAILRVFHSQATLVNSRSAMVNVTQTLVDSLKSQSQPLEIDIEPVMKMITMDVFGRTALSYELDCCKKLTLSPLAGAFDFLGNELIRRARNPLLPTNAFYSLPTSANKRHFEERRLIRNFLQDLIETRRQDGLECSPDLLSSLLKAHDEMKEQYTEEVTDLTLVDIMMSLLFAGYDTTSITLTYALYFLATEPQVEQYCLEEIEQVMHKCGSLDPDKLIYCRGVINETLRLYPPGVSVNRNTTKPIQLSNGFIIPEDTFVAIPIYVIQRDPKHFGRPTEFLPERWVKRHGNEWVVRDTDDTSNNEVPAANRNAFFAFSAGARSCAAQKFALQEAVLVMATLVKQLKFFVQKGYVLEPKRNGIVQSPKNGMPMIITIRE
jgi:cytochrome P450